MAASLSIELRDDPGDASLDAQRLMA